MPKFNPKKVAKVKAFDPDASYSVKDINGGTFAIAHNKKELKQLMKSDADVVYDESKGKLYLNANGEKKGWGKKKDSGLIAKFKGKPELNAKNLEGFSAHLGNTKEQIDSFRHTLSDSEEADLLVDFTLKPKRTLKRVIKDGKKVGYDFDRAELADALEEMDKGGAFIDIELDASAIELISSQGGAMGYNGGSMC